MRRRTSGLWVLVICSSALATGCGGKDPKPVPAAGKVLVDGKPLAGATVMFDPEGQGIPANAGTNDDGSFVLTTRNTGDGALPGTYKVIVKKDLPQPGIKEGGDYTPGSADYLAAMKQAGANRRPPKSTGEIHPKYQSKQTTPITIEIPSGGKKDIKIEVSRKG